MLVSPEGLPGELFVEMALDELLEPIRRALGGGHPDLAPRTRGRWPSGRGAAFGWRDRGFDGGEEAFREALVAGLVSDAGRGPIAREQTLREAFALKDALAREVATVIVREGVEVAADERPPPRRAPLQRRARRRARGPRGGARGRARRRRRRQRLGPAAAVGAAARD